MKIIETLKNLFRKPEPLTIAEAMSVAEILEMGMHRQLVETVAGRTFRTLYSVADENNGFKTVKDGFLCKADAYAFMDENPDAKWLAVPYVVEITK